MCNKSSKLKLYQLGLEEFIKVISNDCKELAGLFMFLWMGFQTQATAQITHIFNKYDRDAEILRIEIDRCMRKVERLEKKNIKLIEENLKQKKMLDEHFKVFNTASMQLIYDEFYMRLQTQDRFDSYKKVVKRYFPNFEQ